jgi:twitching motility two-component system response regulator PilG
MSIEDNYLVDVIGFNEVERSMLSSIFALAARRDPGFAQYEPGTSGRTPDLYLVDADSPEAIGEFRSLHKRSNLPAVLVGQSAAGLAFQLLPRPLQWARLLQALEQVVDSEAEVQAPVDTAPRTTSGSLRRTIPGALRSSPSLPAAEPPSRKRMLGDTVLVVDDNATVRMFMQAKLAPYGFEVDFAETGEEAIGLSANNEYTCVFLDVVLPGIDGYQVCKLIKANKQAIKKTAVVMLTSRSSPFDKLRGSLAGCDEYLTKPLDEDRLLEVIAKFLPGSRKHHEREGRPSK